MFLFVIVQIILLTQAASAEYNLNIKMNYFINENSHKCLTYFRYCLSAELNGNCISLFKTQPIGENSISIDQFKLTTDAIQIKFDSFNSANKLHLLVQAFNSETDELLSNWIVDLHGQTTNKWVVFRQESVQLNQKISFSYKVESPVSPKCDLECLNGGVCVLDSISNQPTCRCNWNYYKGERCEIRILHACNNTKTCLNGGSCYANGDCLCAPGYAGDRCQTKRLTSQCGLFTCYNGGTCYIDNQNEYACICHEAFTGKNCNIKMAAQATTTVQAAETTNNIIPVSVETSTQRANKIETSSKPVQTEASDKLSVEQIILVVLVGVGMPVFFILLAIVLFRLRATKKCQGAKGGDDFVEKKLNKDIQSISHKKENIYVSCSNLNQITTNEPVQENEKFMASIANMKTTVDDVYGEDYSTLSGLDYHYAPIKKSSTTFSYEKQFTSSSSYCANLYSIQSNNSPQNIMISIV
jgi:hypothetical protein